MEPQQSLRVQIFIKRKIFRQESDLRLCPDVPWRIPHHSNLAKIRKEKSHQQVDAGRLSRPVRPKERAHFSRPDAEPRVRQRWHFQAAPPLPVNFGHLAKFNCCCRHPIGLSSRRRLSNPETFSILFPGQTHIRSVRESLSRFRRSHKGRESIPLRIYPQSFRSRPTPRGREASLPSHTSQPDNDPQDRKSTRLNSSHLGISYAVFCLKKKKQNPSAIRRGVNRLRPGVAEADDAA